MQSGLGGLFNLRQKGNFSFGRKKARLDRIGPKLPQMFFRKSKFVLGEPVFIFKIAENMAGSSEFSVIIRPDSK